MMFFIPHWGDDMYKQWLCTQRWRVTINVLTDLYNGSIEETLVMFIIKHTAHFE